MFKKLALLLMVLCLFSVPALADDLGPIPTGSGVESNSATLDNLQPSNQTPLQPTTAVPTNSDSTITGGSALQPTGSKQAALDFIGVAGGDGTMVSGLATASSGTDLQSGLLLGLSAVGFVITALIIFRTSKRLEALPSVPAETAIEPKPALKPRKRRPKKAIRTH